ncbi:MAG TPA: hypothetical protein PKY73_18735 [Hyphomonas sp.]|nr:hypothetical protein [Hyphomonas sp.]
MSRHDVEGAAFSAGQEFAKEIIAAGHNLGEPGIPRSFRAGVYFEVVKDVKSWLGKHPPPRPGTPIHRLLMEKHNALVRAMTENHELREKVAKLEKIGNP